MLCINLMTRTMRHTLDSRRWREANPEKHNESNRRLYKANPEKSLRRSRAWAKVNPEKRSAAARARYKANPEKARKYAREQSRARYKANPEKSLRRSRAWAKANPHKLHLWDKANPEKVRESNRAYCKAHPEVFLEKNRRRRARKLGSGGSFTTQQFVDLCNFYGNICLCCKRSEGELSAVGLILVPDHVIPLAPPHSGSNDISNIQPLCHGRKRGSEGGCNQYKHAKHIDYRISVVPQVPAAQSAAV